MRPLDRGYCQIEVAFQTGLTVSNPHGKKGPANVDADSKIQDQPAYWQFIQSFTDHLQE